MKFILEVGIALLLLAGTDWAKTSVTMTKYTRPDTTIKQDTIITIDTIIISTIYKDTLLFQKKDSIIHKNIRKK